MYPNDFRPYPELQHKIYRLTQLGININHDAISGTSRPYVHEDYNERLSQALT